MSFILRSEFRPIWIVAIVFLVVEGLSWILPLYRFEKSEAALMESTRLKILSGENHYRVLIFGDSRSMSLNPRFGTDAYQDTYNFSLPALGPRYYQSYLEKYLAAGNERPEAILFAGSPLLLMAGHGSPLVDPSLTPQTRPDMSLLSYLNVRGPQRIFRISSELTQPERSLAYEETEWAFFSGRFTRLFSPIDVIRHYRGPERLFLLSAVLPMQLRSYRYREAILNALDPVNYRFQENQHASDSCTCDRVPTPTCLPPSSYYQDNLLVEQARKAHNGMYNISDRITQDRLQILAERDAELRERFRHQSLSIPDVDYSVLQDFLKYLEREQIRYFYLMMPFPEYFQGSPYIKTFEDSFRKVLAEHPQAERLHFRTEFLPRTVMPDHVHVNCEGAARLNAEFTGTVLPELYRRLAADRKP